MKNSTGIEKQHDDFGKKVLAAVPQVSPYVKHRLYIAETSGIVPRNMYKTNGIIDDAIVKLYENFEGKIEDGPELKLKLFSLVNDSLDELFKNEEFHKDTLSTSEILSKELQQLEEKFEMDIDEDLLMSDELDDISYHQTDDKKLSFLYDDAEKNIINTLEIYDSRRDLSEEKRIVLNKIYSWLPLETSNIMDLYVFGKMTFEDIAKIKEVDTSEIKDIMMAVRKSFRKNLN